MTEYKNELKLPCNINHKINHDDAYLIIHQYITENGLSNHALESADDFVDNGIEEIIQKVFKINNIMKNERNKTPEDIAIKTIKYEVDITNIRLKPPMSAGYYSGHDDFLFPNEAHVKDRTYSNSMFIDAHLKATAYMHDGTEQTISDTVSNYRMSGIPTMVGSKVCNTYKQPRDTLIKLGHDPKDPGAYYIKSGREWSIDNIESICFNKPRIFNNNYRTEAQRLEYISKPGDTYQNSKEIILRLLNNECLTIEIVTKNLKTIQFPYYLIFRAFGWSTDKEMFDNILYISVGYPGAEVVKLEPVKEKMFDILKKAFVADYDTKTYKFSSTRNEHKQTDVLSFIVRHVPRDNYKELDFSKDEHLQQGINDFLVSMDEQFLPHIGMDETSRIQKLRFLARLINRMLCVNLGLIEQTDRDSYVDKRIHAPGVSLAKTFKTHYATIVTQIKKQLTKEFKTVSFKNVNLSIAFQSAVHGTDFERLLMQSITSGNKTELKVNRYKSIVNRLSSQLVDRKNMIKVLSTIRMIITPGGDSSKGSDRAKLMRMPHVSFHGFVCYIQSTEGGEKVGLHKQMAISASLTRGSSSEYLKQYLASDTKHFIPCDKITAYEMDSLAAVYVNGDWIGATKDSSEMVYHYTQLRRELKIDVFTSIEWYTDNDEILFWVDYGRIYRPIAIVYNNMRDWKRLGLKGPAHHSKFQQGDLLSPEIIEGIKTGQYTIGDLLKMQIIEFLTPGEQIRMDVAADINHLEQHRKNPLRQFTHRDVPEAMLGIAALTAPLGNYSQTPRNTFQTSQVRQTGGYYAHNWAYRVDKDTFLQYQVGLPIVDTRINNYIEPCGDEGIVAVMVYTGYNEEDSMIFCKATSELGKYNGCAFTFEKDELEKNETICIPDINKTLKIKKYANYSKLGKNGIVQCGTIIKPNDVIIGKVRALQKNIAIEKKKEFSDESVVYKMEFPSIVHSVIREKDDDGAEFVKIGFRSIKPIIIGDKFCLKETAEVLTTDGWIQFKNLTLNHKVATLVDGENIVYEKPLNIVEFDHDGPMYNLQSSQVQTTCTLNHKLYIKKRDCKEYEMIEARKIKGKRVQFKKDGKNTNEDIKYHIINYNDEQYKFKMDDWLDLLGIIITDGYVNKTKITLTGIKPRKIKHINTICKKMNIDIKHDYVKRPEDRRSPNSKYDNTDGFHYIDNPIIVSECQNIHKKAIHKKLPDYCMNLSKRQSLILLNSLISCDGGTNGGVTERFYTSSKKLANQVTILAFHSEMTARIYMHKEEGTEYKFNEQNYGTTNADALVVTINKKYNKPMINHSSFKQTNNIEEYVDYKGKVMCLEVTSHIFYYRENEYNCGHWTGNSARSGQKAVCGLQLSASDMPYTEDGMRPDLIMNPQYLGWVQIY